MNHGDVDQAGGRDRARTHCLNDARRRVCAIALFRTIRRTSACVLLSAMVAVVSFAEVDSKEQMQGLDEQVQEIKSDVLAIAAELSQLEERLLYPSDTQISVFVSLVEGNPLQLDSLQIAVDGAVVANHIYSFKELEALRKGGVQRIYTGNAVTGEHQLEVSIAGRLPGGGDFEDSRVFEFRKDIEPKLVGIALSGREIGIEGW